MELLKDLQIPDILTTLPLIGLYAESHFRFSIPLSRYYKAEPELIFDIPWRLEPGQQALLFLVVKDAHKFPVTLNRIEIEISQKNQICSRLALDIDQKVEAAQTHFEFDLNGADLPLGEIAVLPRLYYSIGATEKTLLVDNYAQTPKTPLRMMLSGDPLPKPAGWICGDVHLHSSLTSDQVEFGASLEQTRKAAAHLGLDFITATDHSYDLDDLEDDYQTNDPSLAKWKESRDNIQALNDETTLTILPGEEISVSNTRGATVHLLHYNDNTYFPGSGDSGEAWPQIHSELTVDQVLERRSEHSVSIAAHSGYKFPWIQRMLLKRGWWEAVDHDNSGLDGVQILCGTPAYAAFHDSRELWIASLLRGKRLGAYGGSDGHGNFNRNWHVKTPMWSLGIHEDQIFGQARTLLRGTSTAVADLVLAMQQRQTAVTTGPVGDLQVVWDGKTAGIGDVVALNGPTQLRIQYSGFSTAEFGLDMDLTLYLGDMGTRQESVLEHQSCQTASFQDTRLLQLKSDAYLRLEITSEGSRWPGVYVSSPIWFEIQ